MFCPHRYLSCKCTLLFTNISDIIDCTRMIQRVTEVRILIVLAWQCLFSGASLRQQLPLLAVPPLHPTILKPNLHLEKSSRLTIVSDVWNIYLRILQTQLIRQLFSVWFWNVFLHLKPSLQTLSLNIREHCSSQHSPPSFTFKNISIATNNLENYFLPHLWILKTKEMFPEEGRVL